MGRASPRSSSACKLCCISENASAPRPRRSPAAVNYRPRTVIFLLLGLMLASVPDDGAQAPRSCIAVACLVWPQLAYWIARRRSREKDIEYYCVLFDCLLGGAIGGAFALRLWPTTAVYSVGAMNALLYGGFRFAAVGVPLSFIPFAATVAALGLPPHFETEPITAALSIAVIFAHVAILGGNSYRARQRHRQARTALEVEERKSTDLLTNVFPKAVIPRLRAGENPIADQFADVTVVFIDIVGFTPLAERLGPKGTVLALNELFAKFDKAAARHGIEKIETTGDGYLAVGGAPGGLDNHPEAAARFALEVLDAARATVLGDGEPIRVRIGLHTGPVLAGVIGESRFHYKVFGETVNVASRVQSECQAGRVLVSEATSKRIRGIFPLEEHGTIELKGHGPMRTFWLLSSGAGLRGQGFNDSAAVSKRA